MPAYRTKTQRKRALISIRLKAFKLVECDCMTMADYVKINDIVKKGMKKLG